MLPTDPAKNNPRNKQKISMWHGEVLTNAPHIQVDPQKEPLQIKIAGDDQFASEVRPIRKSDQINRRDAHLHDVKVGASEAVDWICASIKPAFASISCGTAPGAVENYIESELDNAVDQQRNEEPLKLVIRSRVATTGRAIKPFIAVSSG